MHNITRRALPPQSDQQPAADIIITAVTVRDAFARLGRDITATRTRAVVLLCREKGFGLALRWAYSHGDQQVARDVRSVFGGLYTDPQALLNSLDATVTYAYAAEQRIEARERIERIRAYYAAPDQQAAA
jgi:hypothetical protein